MIREVRRSDTVELFRLMQTEFPEESALLGGRPEEFEKIVKRVFRWDTRFLLWILKVFGRPVFDMLVVDSDGTFAGSAMLSFPGPSVYLSNVVVDPRFRRRGYARKMFEDARRRAQRMRRRFLVLDVLESNAPARALYDSLGYQPLRSREQLLADPAQKLLPAPTTPTQVRPFEKRDSSALVAIVRRETPPLVEEVMPTTERMFAGSALANRLMELEERAWVIDRGRGAEGYVSAQYSKAFEAGHLSAPVIGESVEPALAETLVRVAGAWCASNSPPRLLAMAAEENARGRTALEAAGFRHAFKLWTLYRAVD